MDMPTGDEPMMSKQAAMAAGLPPSKQMQSEESLPALDDEERKAVQMRARDRLNARNGRSGDSQISPTLKSSARSPGKSARSSSRLPGYMTPKTGGRSARSAKSSRSAMLTNRTSSPTGRYHPVAERKLEIRQVRAARWLSPRSCFLLNTVRDCGSASLCLAARPSRRPCIARMSRRARIVPVSLPLFCRLTPPPMTHASPQADLLANIDYLAPHGAPDNDRKAKESSWLVSQAFIEGLRYYPTGQVALDGNDCEATYSGNTHHRGSSVFEHMETDLRSRLDIAPAEMEWREDQLPREWVPEKRPSMIRHMAKVRERLKR